MRERTLWIVAAVVIAVLGVLKLLESTVVIALPVLDAGPSAAQPPAA